MQLIKPSDVVLTGKFHCLGDRLRSHSDLTSAEVSPRTISSLTLALGYMQPYSYLCNNTTWLQMWVIFRNLTKTTWFFLCNFLAYVFIFAINDWMLITHTPSCTNTHILRSGLIKRQKQKRCTLVLRCWYTSIGEYQAIFAFQYFEFF